MCVHTQPDIYIYIHTQACSRAWLSAACLCSPVWLRDPPCLPGCGRPGTSSHACPLGAWSGRPHGCVEQHMVFSGNSELRPQWVTPRSTLPHGTLEGHKEGVQSSPECLRLFRVSAPFSAALSSLLPFSRVCSLGIRHFHAKPAVVTLVIS